MVLNFFSVVSVEELVILKSTSKVFTEASSSEVEEWTREGRSVSQSSFSSRQAVIKVGSSDTLLPRILREQN